MDVTKRWNYGRYTYKRFLPPCKRDDLERLYYDNKSGVIRVSSQQKDNDLIYLFKGCASFAEFIDALTYVMYWDDKKHGIASYAAMHGYYVYASCLNEHARIKRRLKLWLGGSDADK